MAVALAAPPEPPVPGGCKVRERDAPMNTVWIYVDTNKEVGDADHLKVFANRDAADAWLAKNDPEGTAFEYDVLGEPWPIFEAENI